MIILDRTSKEPLYEQIYRHIRDEIIGGGLEEGHRLTATRIQAENLGVSRNTVELSYLQLCSEGYLDNRRGSGYYVNYIDTSLIKRPEGVNRCQPDTEKRQEKSLPYDLKYGNCHMENFPLNKWKKAMDRALLEGDERRLVTYGDSCGSYPLRGLLAEYLEKDRGVRCTPEQIVIGSGTQFLLGLVCQLLDLKRVAVEEPGYDGAKLVFHNHQIEALPVAVKQDGLDLKALCQKNAEAVYVTPSHQFPLGVVMPVQRRMELIRWAREKNAYVIEDDYDSVFRYTAKAIPSMQGLDQSGRVLYFGGISKALSPALRLAYMVLPARLKAEYDRKFSGYHNTVPILIQDALCIFMEEGGWESQLRKTCLANKRKQEIFLDVLEKKLDGRFRIRGKGAGLHLILESETLSGEEMAGRAETQGIKIYPMTDYYIEKKTGCNLAMVGYGGIAMDEAELVADRLAEALLLSPKDKTELALHKREEKG